MGRTLLWVLVLAGILPAQGAGGNSPLGAPRVEPPHVADPLYAQFRFGPQGRIRVWAILDKSKESLEYYDVLYWDRNGNGDLTEPGERITASWSERGKAAGMAVVLKVGKVAIPGSGEVHTDLRISTVRKPGRKGIWCRLRWRGRHELSGGQTTGGDCTRWGRSPEDAPVLWPTLERPFTFAFWGWGADEVELAIGKATRVYLMAGIRGSRSDTLMVVDEDFLRPPGDRIVATLLAKGREGRPISLRTEITGHC